MREILEAVDHVVWGVPMLILILGAGLYLSFGTGFAQFRLLPAACRAFFEKLRGKACAEGVSPFQALCTALAATVGTGNIAGVAGAIAIGGPGAVLWMWVSALLGMVIKFTEATLAVRYRTVQSNGEYVGGPMYMIEHGLGKRWNWLAKSYCLFGVIAAFGIGNATQINAVISGLSDALRFFGKDLNEDGKLAVGILLGIIVSVMLLGGARRIGKVAEFLVPFASLAYILLCLWILVLRCEQIPQAFSAIIQGAFSPRAVTGGAVGSCFSCLRVGVSRGVFTNEAGMGTASIAHAGANVSYPTEQGLMGIVEVFLDTILICTLTAMVILCSGVSIPYGLDEGAALTNRAFSFVLGNWISVLLALFLCCFAFATVLGWGLYGARCAEYLFGINAWRIFAWGQGITVIFGSVLGTGTVWLLSETVNGLMAIPNLIALIVLSPELFRLTKAQKALTKRCVQ